MTAISPSPDDIHPRRPIVAALLSLALPGLGQLYNGEVNKALWLFLGFVLIGAPGETIAALYVPAALMLPLLVLCVLLTFGVWLYAIADAWRSAKNRQIYTRREWQVSGLYALLFITGNAAILSLFVDTVRPHQVEPFRIPSASMEPSILKATFSSPTSATTAPIAKAAWGRATSEIFVYPNDRTTYYIKRVIGLPGDHVTIKGHEVAVNGKSLTRENPSTASGSWLGSSRASVAGACNGTKTPPARMSMSPCRPDRFSCSATTETTRIPASSARFLCPISSAEPGRSGFPRVKAASAGSASVRWWSRQSIFLVHPRQLA